MKKALTIRGSLQLSQQDMANYLHISRSTLKKHELGLRPLPAAALLKLEGLQSLLDQYREQAGKDVVLWEQSVQPQLSAFVAEEAALCRRKINTLQRKLNRYNDSIQTIHVLDTLLQATTDKAQRMWAELQVMTFRKKAAKTEKTICRCYCKLQVLLKQATALEKAAGAHQE